MKSGKEKYFVIFALFLSLAINLPANSQEVIEIEPLFEYPIAPEELTSLTDKSDYLVKHFWDNFDFKSKKPVDQMLLNDAFKVFAVPIRWANLSVANQSVDKLIDKISANPTLLLQFTKAAEENLYGPRADFWVDEIYLKFLEAALKNKKISETRKTKLRTQANSLRSSALNGPAPTFSFEKTNGDKAEYFPMTTPTLIIFGDPEDTDWRLARLRMETNSNLTQAIDKGRLNLLFIVRGDVDNWQQSVSNYSEKWVVGKGIDLDQTIDLRVYPSVYLIGSDGKLLMKNVTLDRAIDQALQMLES